MRGMRILVVGSLVGMAGLGVLAACGDFSASGDGVDGAVEAATDGAAPPGPDGGVDASTVDGTVTFAHFCDQFDSSTVSCDDFDDLTSPYGVAFKPFASDGGGSLSIVGGGADHPSPSLVAIAAPDLSPDGGGHEAVVVLSDLSLSGNGFHAEMDFVVTTPSNAGSTLAVFGLPAIASDILCVAYTSFAEGLYETVVSPDAMATGTGTLVGSLGSTWTHVSMEVVRRTAFKAASVTVQATVGTKTGAPVTLDLPGLVERVTFLFGAINQGAASTSFGVRVDNVMVRPR